ncbi:MAG: acyl-phosphate glycerol 3-phosphate acyltransferase [Lentisphaerae bacterium GWF2_45_14]|nr:MAG: acyl-phosphate glycerol 3-phosphate acyltransferase [Lentisphaerae bacterium GWF2_45_14]
MISSVGFIIVSYIFASIPWGFVIGKLRGIDIRKHGSGNIGATNVTRVLGKWAGRICFLMDFLKGLLPVLLAMKLISAGFISDCSGVFLCSVVFACVAGHMWSIFLKFTGGKGMSTSAGALLALSPYATITCAAVWFTVFLYSKYVSLASIAAAVVLPVAAIIFAFAGVWPLPPAVLVLLVIITFLAVFKHRANIERLRNGTENRFVKVKRDTE